MEEETQRQERKALYLWLSLALYLPLLLLPMRMRLSDAVPVFGSQIEVYWLALGGVLLLASVVADGVLSSAEEAQGGVLLSGVWIFVVAVVLPYLLTHPAHAWWLGLLLFLHAWRAGWRLLLGGARWWHGIAWWRDIAASLTVFYWLSDWSVYYY